MKNLMTERLIMRQFTPDDAGFVLELLNTPGWLQYIGDRGIRTTTLARKYITDRILACYDAYGFGMYLVLLKDEGLPIGMCGLLRREMLDNVDIGFALLPDHEGKGYALEAADAMMSFARHSLGLEKIVAITNPGNFASQKLLKKLDMKFIKMVRISVDEEELMLFGN